ncbi:photosystem reaction center subunit H [Actinomadura craniellae]|uniref:Photosystem reaction center subunit H n=1 Tax=Actinomadura craniellae TaxID=2231787 RepID=A0A365HBU1_9ACTN|nr:PRC and DUF2382 domain-containing protein [Actinomadura craniellae]RAY16509.1 photosystem reaction center subunit H [Actinomadura craniellae]
MITQEQIPKVLDHTVYDTNGDKIGDIRHVFLDDATGRPEWLCVRTGLFGTRETFVPTRSAELVSDHVEVGYDKDRIRHAPHVDVDARGHLSAAEERELYQYYDIDWTWESADRPGGAAEPGGGPARAREGGRHERGRPQAESGRHERGRPGAESAGLQGPAMTRSEEHLRVSTESHEAGRARLHKYVVTEQEQVTVPVSHEEVRLEREPITPENRDAALSGPEISEAEQEIILTEEQVVVSKETTPVERVRATKERIVEQETVGGEVRKERIELEVDEETGRKRPKNR